MVIDAAMIRSEQFRVDMVIISNLVVEIVSWTLICKAFADAAFFTEALLKKKRFFKTIAKNLKYYRGHLYKDCRSLTFII